MNKKAILLPIQPRWCELIAAGKKKYELRKMIPNQTVWPVTVYVYQSKHKWTYSTYDTISDWQGKVIGKFTFKKATPILTETVKKILEDDCVGMIDEPITREVLYGSCVLAEDIIKYVNGKDVIYGWRIDNFELFEKPMNLSDFYTDCCDYLDENQCCRNTESCCYREYCDVGDYSPCVKEVKSAPQNYCFVEEIV